MDTKGRNYVPRDGISGTNITVQPITKGFGLTDSLLNDEEETFGVYRRANSLRLLHMCNPFVFLFLSRFLTAPPTLLPKQMQASHLCTLPVVNTHTQGNRLTCGNTFTLPRRLRVPCEQLHQQHGPLAVATVQNIPAAPSGLGLTTQRASQLPSTGVDRRQEEEEEEEKLFSQRQSKKQLDYIESLI